MSLTTSQKKFIRQNRKELTVDQLAKRLGLSEEVVKNYVYKKWTDAKLIRKDSVFPSNFLTPHDLKLVDFIKKNIPIFLFLAILVGITYADSIHNVFLSDDLLAIPQNPIIGKFQMVLREPIAFGRPLVYYLAYKIGGLNPEIYRLFNILFHLGTTWLVFILMSFFYRRPLPFFIASVFAVHPILVESVTWISGGAYAQYVFFLIASLIVYIMAGRNKRWYWVSIILFFFGLMSNRNAVVFPLIIVAFELAHGTVKKTYVKIIPYFLMSGGLFLLFFTQLGRRVAELQTSFYQEPGLANPFFQVPFSIASYLTLIFFPKSLSFYHGNFALSYVRFSLYVLVFLIFLGILIGGYKKNKHIFFWLSFFIISLLPTLTPLKIAWIVAERYVYLGTIGVIATFFIITQRFFENPRYKTAAQTIAVAIIIVLSIRSIARNVDWKNEDNLWIATGRTAPTVPYTHNNLGDMYVRHKDFKAAETEFQIAINLNPRYADAYHNLANVYWRTGQLDKAIASYNKAIQFNPTIWQSRLNLAAIYFNQKRYEKALSELSKAIAIAPQNPTLYNNMGVVYVKTGKKKEAKEAFEKSLSIDPNNQNARQALATLQ